MNPNLFIRDYDNTADTNLLNAFHSEWHTTTQPFDFKSNPPHQISWTHFRTNQPMKWTLSVPFVEGRTRQMLTAICKTLAPLQDDAEMVHKDLKWDQYLANDQDGSQLNKYLNSYGQPNQVHEPVMVLGDFGFSEKKNAIF